MACEVCEHCQSPVSRDERVTIREGFSYHKRCHKCYVCSETNLLNAEVFKGVIFCSSCAQRIFQGCSTARRTKATHGGRTRRTRSKSHRRDRERLRTQDRRTDRSRDGVIELAGLAGSTTTDSEDHRKQQQRKPSKSTISTEVFQAERNREENCFYLQPMCKMKKDSTEMGTTTDVTQELLRQINCPIPDCKAKSYSPEVIAPPRKHHRKKENIEPVRNKPICSDLRMAELGVSTEIANMALRKKSEVPVIIKSNNRLKGRTSYSLSVLNQESVLHNIAKHRQDIIEGVEDDAEVIPVRVSAHIWDRKGIVTVSPRAVQNEISADGTDWLDSAYSTIEESETTNMMDRRLGSILRLPLKFFKKNILTRSSLISVLMSTDDERNINLLRRMKHILHEEVTEHQIRGVKRLYSTINRKRTPYKLGWVDLVAKVSKIREQNNSICTCAQNKRCKHFTDSHSYRCMRAQVMKLAGPTTSELACYRNKIKRFIAPQFLRNIITSNKDYPAIKLSQACGRSCNSGKP